jgi:hypothetical protein
MCPFREHGGQAFAAADVRRNQANFGAAIPAGLPAGLIFEARK